MIIMAKINISIDDNLLERLDKVAYSSYMSRSGLIAMACVQYINSNEVIAAVKDLSVSMRKIADTGKVDSETLEQLEDLERICKILMQSH